MNERIAIIGVGATPKPGDNFYDESFKELVVEASYAAINDAGIKPEDLDAASFSYIGEGEIGYGGIGSTLVDALGLSPIPAYVNSANCSSAHVAFLSGCEMVLSGNNKIVLVCGFDKHTDLISLENYMVSSDSMYDFSLGFSHVDYYLLAFEYFKNYSINPLIQKECLLKFAKLMRTYAYHNPIASLYKVPVPTDEQLACLPLYGNALSPGEGASAVIITTESNLKMLNINHDPVFVSGTGYVTGSHYVAHRYQPELVNDEFFRNINIKPTLGMALPLELACKQAYQKSKLKPSDIGILGLYDQIVNQFISIEATGICEKGKAPQFIIDGDADIQGKCPINTDGGNIGRGHASGGASLYQVIEIVKQLQHRAEGLKVPKETKHGMSTVVGGYYAYAVSIILSNL
jgi:acetyl-CoA acetyltransferase